MAQPCSIEEAEQKKKQLKVATYSYMCEKYWQKYNELCTLDEVTPKNLLSDLSYYEHVDEIEDKHVQKVIKEAIQELYIKAKEMDPEKRAKRGKIPNNLVKRVIICGNCKGTKIMFVNAHCSGAGTIIYPSGIQHDGAFPHIPKLCYDDDLNMHLCVDCGFLVGFDKKVFAEAIEKAEYLE